MIKQAQLSPSNQIGWFSSDLVGIKRVYYSNILILQDFMQIRNQFDEDSIVIVPKQPVQDRIF